MPIAIPSQQPDTTIASHATLARKGESHLRCNTRHIEITWKGTGRLRPRAQTVLIHVTCDWGKSCADREPETALWRTLTSKNRPTTITAFATTLNTILNIWVLSRDFERALNPFRQPFSPSAGWVLRISIRLVSKFIKHTQISDGVLRGHVPTCPGCTTPHDDALAPLLLY